MLHMDNKVLPHEGWITFCLKPHEVLNAGINLKYFISVSTCFMNFMYKIGILVRIVLNFKFLYFVVLSVIDALKTLQLYQNHYLA